MSDVDVWTWMKELREAPQVTKMKLAVLLTVATSRDLQTRRARVSQATLARWTGHSVSRVREVLQWARDAGYLEQVVRGHRTWDGKTLASEYVLTLPQPAPDGAVDASTQPPPEGAVEADTQPLQTAHTTAPNRSLNRSLREHPSVATPSETSSSEEQPMRDEPADRGIDDDDDFPTITAVLRREQLDARNWTTWHITRSRDIVWDRLGLGADFRAVLLALIDKHVLDPLAYLANITDADLEALTHHTPRAPAPDPTAEHERRRAADQQARADAVDPDTVPAWRDLRSRLKNHDAPALTPRGTDEPLY